MTYQSDLCEVGPLVHVTSPAFGDDFVQVWVTMSWTLQAISIPNLAHDFSCTHARIRR